MKRIVPLTLTTFVFITFGCDKIPFSDPPKTLPHSEVIYVKVPPLPDPNLTVGENQCVFSEFLFPSAYPKDIIKDCRDAPVVIDDSLLFVKLTEDDALSINSQRVGSLPDINGLTERLAFIFSERTRNGVFEPSSDRVLKAVGIRIPISKSYGVLMTVANAVKESGADPIILLLDGYLPNQLIPPPNKGRSKVRSSYD